MFEGQIYVTTDLNTVGNMLTSNKIVFIGSPEPQLVQQTNGINGSILIPPYHAISAYLDGNLQEFYRMYGEHLSSREPALFISTIIRAIMQGTNILLYLDNNEFEMYYRPFSEFILNAYGLNIGTPSNQFSINQQYIPRLFEILYLNELMSVQEFILICPENYYLNDYVVGKLYNELRPILPNNSIESCREYFTCLIRNEQMLARGEMISVIGRV